MYAFFMRSISRRILGLGFVSALVSAAFPALAADMPTVKCRFLGQTTTYKGKLYTCIKGKSKGKTILTWNSGKVIPAPTVTASQTPTASPTPTPSSSPTVKPEPIVVKAVEISLAKSSEVPDGSTKFFTARNRFGNETTYVLARYSGVLIAMNPTCTHNGCKVALAAAGLQCPCHNALFDAQDGAVLRGPAAHPLDRLSVREADNTIYVTD
jgi:Rieske Fe-S protein